MGNTYTRLTKRKKKNHSGRVYKGKPGCSDIRPPFPSFSAGIAAAIFFHYPSKDILYLDTIGNLRV